jgi:pimeloyl-ACP methyl ester carboxylesterase
MFRDRVFDWTSTSVMVDHDHRIRAHVMEDLRDRQFEPLQRRHTPIGNGLDLARWLGELLSALSVDRAHLVGCSYGGWLAVQHEIHSPGRATTITLLDPAGFGRLTGRFLMWVIMGGLAPGQVTKPLPQRQRPNVLECIRLPLLYFRADGKG